ncbi:cytochrome P450 [Lactifluus volemus]|nr:cytochrome P450 [Lactifluus volemus]
MPLGPYEVSKISIPQLRQAIQDNKTLSIGLILGLVVLCTAHYLASPYRKLPPGPRGYPIIGNLLELKPGQWLKYSEWQKKYGDLIYLNAAGQPMIILNSPKVAADLLDRRAAIYSDRPPLIVASEIMCGGLLFPFCRYGDVWRRMRKIANERFSKESVKQFCETQMTEAVLLASDSLAKPAQLEKNIRRSAASMILSVVYGHPTITSEKNRIVDLIDEFGERLARAACPGAHLVEFFNWMQYIPSRLAKWKQYAETWHKKDTEMFEGLMEPLRLNVAKGDDDQSLGATLIRNAEKHKLSSKELSWLAGTLYVGGTDTTATSMAWWLLAMLAYPETQARAQTELDEVVGRDRLPTFEDYPHLPYIRAMVKEILRWSSITPMSVPHRSSEDDWYEGMFIPKGSICIPNVWHMNRDPEIYGEDAAHFNPARFLDANGDVLPGPSDTKEEGHFTFGFGRRICLGRNVATNSLFIDIAMMLWASKIERKKDDGSGQLLPLDVDGFVEQGILLYPAPYKYEMTPRFPEAQALLARERELRGL